MREVRLEHDAVEADLVDQQARGDALEPVTAVYLAPEVIARQQLELRALGAHVTAQEVVVAGLEHERDPADAALHRDEGEFRKARQDARQQEVDEVADGVLDHRRRGARVGDRAALDRRAFRTKQVRQVAAPDVEADRQTGRLGGCPDRVPVAIREVRHAVLVRGAAEEHGAVPEGRGAFDLAHRGRHVPERQGSDRHEALGGGPDPVDQEVVVGTHAREHQLRVVEPEEDGRGETADVRIEDLRVDAARVHHFQAFGGVVGCRMRVGQRRRYRRPLVLPAVARACRRRAEVLIAHQPHLRAARRVPLHVRNAIAPLRRDPAGPEVGGFRDVRIRVDDGNRHHSFPPRSRGW